jgi:chloramphenicol-sensitive protein RarD
MNSAEQQEPHGSGLPFALGAYFIWGFFPLYFTLLKGVAPLDIMTHRIVWSLPVIFVIIYFRGQWSEFRAAIGNPVALRTMALSSLFIATNWLIYVWAVLEGHVLASSIGYYLNPLVNALLGRIFLNERLSRLQAVAVGVAVAGVMILAGTALDTLWISLSLAVSFSCYGLVRKMAVTGSVPGLAVELCIMGPAALAYLLWTVQNGQGPQDLYLTGLLAAGGLLTVIPLLLFATAARRMSYTALGFVQYIGPTIVFLLGVFQFHEPLGSARLACFVLIWTAIAIFSWDALKRTRATSFSVLD